MQRSALCRSRRELSNAYLLAKIGVDTAENEPCKVCPLSVYRSPRCMKCKFESNTYDPFLDLSLEMEQSVHQAFKKFTAVEM